MGLRGVFQLYMMANDVEQYSHSLCVWIGSPFTGGFAANQIAILALAMDRIRAVVAPFKLNSISKVLLKCLLTLQSFGDKKRTYPALITKQREVQNSVFRNQLFCSNAPETHMPFLSAPFSLNF